MSGVDVRAVAIEEDGSNWGHARMLGQGSGLGQPLSDLQMPSAASLHARTDELKMVVDIIPDGHCRPAAQKLSSGPDRDCARQVESGCG